MQLNAMNRIVYGRAPFPCNGLKDIREQGEPSAVCDWEFSLNDEVLTAILIQYIDNRIK